MIDPLSVSITTKGVDTKLPLLPEADYVMQVEASSIDANKDQTGLNWNLKLVTTSEIAAVDGRAIKPNFPVYATPQALQPKADSKDPEAFLRGLCSTIDALFGTSIEDRPDFSKELADAAVGKLVVAHIYIDTYEGRQSNKVKFLKHYQG